MKHVVRSIALGASLLMTGCIHKTQQVQTQAPLAPPIEDAPLPKPNSAPANLPPPVISVPQPDKPAPATTAAKPEPPPAPAPRKKKPSAGKPAQTTTAAAPPATEQAANASPEVPAIGNLSSGDAQDMRGRTVTLINDTDRGLKGLNRKLNDQEEKTSTQIREFLKQARTALNTNDVDGAHTLAVKAKVLLDELNP